MTPKREEMFYKKTGAKNRRRVECHQRRDNDWQMSQR